MVSRPAFTLEVYNNRTVKLFTEESQFFEKGIYIAKIPKDKFEMFKKYFRFIDLTEINNKLYDSKTAESTPNTIVFELMDDQLVFVRANDYYEPQEFKWFLRLLYSLYYTLNYTRIN